MNVDIHTWNVLSLCTGYGGAELGLRLAVPRARTVCMVERETFLAGHMVQAMEEGRLAPCPVFTDVRTFDGRPWRGVVDCIVGGYPCQPFSIAGRRLGSADPRHLWPAIQRIVDEVRPPYCFFENVDDHLRLGFDQVIQDLEAMDYVVEAGIFSSAETGASHVRERLYIMAFSDGARREECGDTSGARAANCGRTSAGTERAGGVLDAASSTGRTVGEPTVLGHERSGAARRRQPRLADPGKPLGDPKGLRRGETKRWKAGGAGPDAPGGEVGNADGRGLGGKNLSDVGQEAGQKDVDELGASRSLGHASGERLGKLRQGPQNRQEETDAGSPGETLDNPMLGRYGNPEEAISAGRLPAEPPGRNDERGWRESLESYPYLAPKLPVETEPGVSRMVDEIACRMAYRIDRVRAIGNGIDPVVFAVAFSTLWHRIHGETR